MIDLGGLFEIHRQRYPGLILGIIAGAITAALGLFRITSPVDRFLYDELVSWATAVAPMPPRVLLVEGDPSLRTDSKRLLALLDELEKLGAQDVLFLFTPEAEGDDVWREMARRPGVVCGRAVSRDPLERDRWILDPPPSEALALGVRFGVVHLERGDRGVHRNHRAWFSTASSPLLSIEASVLPPAQTEKLLAKDPRIAISFAGGAGSLPTVTVDRILDQRVIPELVRARPVLVGIVATGPGSGIATPTTHGSSGEMSVLEFHGHALNTLLSNREMRRLGTLGLLIVAFAVSILVGLLHQWGDTGFSMTVLAGGIALLLVATLASVLLDRLWLPVTELSIAQIGLFIASIHGRAVRSTSGMRSLVLRTAARIERKGTTDGFDLRADAWTLIVSMVNQTLDLNRVLFFETRPGRWHVASTMAINCSFEDFLETRRDYRRAPYVTALEAAGPVRLENLLRVTGEPEDQYLIPIVFAGEVLGFWVCAVDRRRSVTTNTLEDVLSDFSTLIGEILFRRRRLETADSWLTKLDTYLSHDPARDGFRRLSDALDRIDLKIKQAETILQGSSTAVIVYNLFGRVVFVNDRMLSLLENEHLSPDQITALDLVAGLSEFDIAKSRRVLRHVFVERQHMSFPIELSGNRRRRWVMHLQALDLGVEGLGSDAVESLGTRAILCEIMDTTSLSGVFELKGHLAKRLGLQLRNDLAAIDVSASLLSGEKLAVEERHHVAQLVREKVTGTVNALVECQQFLSLDSESHSIECFPVDPQPALGNAVTSIRAQVESRAIEVVVRQPRLMRYVLAYPEALQTVFDSVLELLAADATDESHIEIDVSETEDLVCYDFKNLGFGIPDDRLQEFLTSDAALASDHLRRMREAMSLVESWGGELQVHSEVGRGTVAWIRLVKFY